MRKKSEIFGIMELNNRDGKIKKNRGIVELRIFKGQRVSRNVWIWNRGIVDIMELNKEDRRIKRNCGIVSKSNRQHDGIE